MKVDIESKTTDGKTTQKYEINGKPVSFWKALPYIIIFAVATVILGPVVLAILGIAALMIGIALVMVAIAIIPAGIYRLVTGRWPDWFKVEHSKTTTEDHAE